MSKEEKDPYDEVFGLLECWEPQWAVDEMVKKINSDAEEFMDEHREEINKILDEHPCITWEVVKREFVERVIYGFNATMEESGYDTAT